MDCTIDRLVSGAAAEVAGERDTNLVDRRIGTESRRRDDHSRRADAALRSRLVHEVPLQGMLVTEPLDGHDLAPLDLRCWDETRNDDLTVDEYCARSALSLATTLSRARQRAILAQHVEEALHRMRLDQCRLAVQRELHAARMISGVAGISHTSMPRCRMAFTIAGAGPSIGSSPSPFAPNGPSGYGFSRME